MNSIIANTELTGFMDMYKVNGINHIMDYHLFIRCGDKVYMGMFGDKSKYVKHIDELCNTDMKSTDAMVRILCA
jgi:hypothetical protein